MKKLFRHKGAWLAGMAAALALCVSAGPAMAYFTDSANASGGIAIALAGRTEIFETEVTDWVKHVVVTNTGNTDVYVRAAAFAGDKYTLDFSGDGWSDGGDGYWYYAPVVPAGESAGELLIAIGGMDGEDGAFSVVVAQECVPVTYVDGEARADWSAAVPASEEG